MARPSQQQRRELLIWALVGSVLAGAAALVAAHVGSLGALTSPHVPWWALALGFAAAERAVVHLHFRRSAHSFTMGDVPVVFGLLFASAPQLLIGALAGSAAMWLLSRRLPPIKLAFNIAQLALAICVAETIVHAYTTHVDAIHPVLWLITFLAVESAALVTVALIGAAIRLSEGELPAGMLRQMFGFDLLFTLTSTALGLLAAVVVKADAIAVPLVLLPAAAAYLAYSAYLHERQRHEKLQFLYEAARSLAQTPDVTDALARLLAQARDVFRVELAELVLFSSESRPPLRIAVSADGEVESMVPAPAQLADGLRELAASPSPGIVRPAPADDSPVDAYLRERGIHHAIVAQLPGDGRIAGTLMIANRVGVVREFDADDVALLDALGTNASVALQFDRLEQAVWQLKDLHEQLEHRSSHDPLTDLVNRAQFMGATASALERERSTATVLLVDIDDFSKANDSLGPTGGDSLLLALTERLRSYVLPADVLARVGGDEFAILLADVPDPARAGNAVAERILHGLAAPILVDGRRTTVSVSIGIAVGRAGYEDAEELIGNADVAMHHVKQAGKRRASTFEPRMRASTIERRSIRVDLETALDHQQLSVDFQPIASLSDGRIVAAEALLRWRRQYGQRLSAAEFIPLAQETGMILPLGEFVLREACQQAFDWLSSGAFGHDIAVHVNLSAAEVDDPTLVSRVASILEQTALPPHLLVLEVTEAAALRDPARATTHLTELRNRGIRLALDDFGVGHLSLDYLHTLPFGFLKISRAFVSGITSGNRDVAFVRTVRELSQTLGLKLIAAGIETADQFELLHSLGCDLGQGFLIGRPGPPSSILPRGYPLGDEPGAWLRTLGEQPSRNP